MLIAVLTMTSRHSAEVPASQDPRVLAMPLVEVAATGVSAPALAGRLAIVLSGDGGWASLDRKIAGSFAQAGIPVVGVDSLRYFWSGRTPEQAAGDVAALITHYLAQWHLSRVDLVGYSFGADVLPFIVNRLPAATAARLSSITLVEPSESATFEIHVSNWLPGVTTPGEPLAPELARLKPAPLCIYGAGDDAQHLQRSARRAVGPDRQRPSPGRRRRCGCRAHSAAACRIAGMTMSDDSRAKGGLHLRMHLLLIEDDAEAAKYLAKGLRESGYTVDVAANGRDGLFQATEAAVRTDHRRSPAALHRWTHHRADAAQAGQQGAGADPFRAGVGG